MSSVPRRENDRAGIEGVTDMEYKMFSGNPGPNVFKRPRKGNE